MYSQDFQEDPLEEGMTTHSQYSCLGNPMDKGAWGCRDLDMTEVT